MWIKNFLNQWIITFKLTKTNKIYRSDISLDKTSASTPLEPESTLVNSKESDKTMDKLNKDRSILAIDHHRVAIDHHRVAIGHQSTIIQETWGQIPLIPQIIIATLEDIEVDVLWEEDPINDAYENKKDKYYYY